MSEETPKPKLDLQTLIVGIMATVLSGSGGFIASHQEAKHDAEWNRSERDRLELRVSIAESNIKGLANWINHKNEVELIGPPSPSPYE